MIRNIEFDKVKLSDGFWKRRYDLNGNVSIYAVKKRFEDTGRFDAVRFTGGKENIHVYYDSDVAKWIEAVAYLVGADKEKYADLAEFCDGLIDKMAENQRDDGYFNSYFQQKEPTEIFKRRNDHELYCAGHIIEAAIAYDKYVKKGKLLEIAERYAQYIYKVFVEEESAGFVTCGHEEIELALFRLYDYTHNGKYLSLAKFFVEKRGNNDKDQIIANKFTFQDNLPARELSEADGHAVRAMYYYCAMADMAKFCGDKQMGEACQRLFRNIITQKMYVTGGLGSNRLCESFTAGYDLPNLTAYAESCAGIGFIMFAARMNELYADGVFSDVIERVLYNVFMSSTSLDGKSFFYENPLEICRKEKGKETAVIESRRPVLPIWRRKEVFDCSCCPPNINRFVATVGGLIYTQTEKGIYVNQYISSRTEGIKITTDYPNEKTVKISGENYKYNSVFVRIPSWCEKYTVTAEGKTVIPEVEKGYAKISVGENFNIVLTLDFKPEFIESNPKVRENAGRVCLKYGPVVYCLEEVDNGGDLYSLSVDKNVKEFKESFSPLYGLNVFEVKGYRSIAAEFSPLYAKEYKRAETTLKFIPYFAFANREESDMLVWLPKNNG